MSTDESDSITSSQIRRFGLYRTIDAKTEEFLRLSRKRQMRQGCACAAISTTITVTVVVSFILIYEYSTISEVTSKTTLAPNWLNFMNSTSDDLPFEVKLDKAKSALDPATIKFIPLLLKTLKKHKYFDNILEEPSSPNPLEDMRETRENIFADTRNWMRMPTSRLYTIEYKTSPIVYFKNPTRNIDYFKKVRKIRDYQRIMNYVDKMISERVTFGSTQPMAKHIYDIHKNSMADLTTPMTKVKEYKVTTQRTHKVKTKQISSNEKKNCNCPKRINEILNKLFSGINSLLPNFYKTKSSQGTKPCKHLDAKKTNVQKKTLKPKLKSASKSYDSMETVTSTTPYSSEQPTTILPKIDYTLNAIIALLKPSIQQKGINRKKLQTLKITSTKNDIERTESNYMLEDTTEAMGNSATLLLPTSAITIKDFILKSHSVRPSKPFSSFPVMFENEFEDNFESTTITGEGTHNLRLMESKNITNDRRLNSNDTEGEKSYPCQGCKEESNKLLEKTIDLSSTVSSYVNTNFSRQSHGKTESITIEVTTIRTRSGSEINLKNKTTLPYTGQASTENETMEQYLKLDDDNLEEDTEKTSYEEGTPEDDIKNLENILKTLNNSNVHNETTTENSELYEWELIKIEDKYDTREDIKSMIPQDRASYLEIQRNEWKQDEQQDYDNNINQYLFE